MKRVPLAFLLCLGLIAASTAQQGMGPGPGLGKPPGAAASDFATDSFTDTNNTTLASHTPEVGGTITKHPDAAYTSTATIDSNELFPAGTTAYYYASSPPSADYYVQVTFHALTLENTSMGQCGHMDTTANTMVCIRNNNGTSWELRQIITGTGSTLGTSTNQLPSAGQSKVVKLVFASGGTTAAVVVEGVTEISAQTISVTGAGKVGMRLSGGLSTTTGIHLDSFSAR